MTHTTHGSCQQSRYCPAQYPRALRLRERLDRLENKPSEGGQGKTATILIIGDGLTGIETATEIAESRPTLAVTLIARGQLGARLSGAPAILFVIGDSPEHQVVGAVTFDLADSKIAMVRGIAAPARLVRLTEAWRHHEPGSPIIAQW